MQVPCISMSCYTTDNNTCIDPRAGLLSCLSGSRRLSVFPLQPCSLVLFLSIPGSCRPSTHPSCSHGVVYMVPFPPPIIPWQSVSARLWLAPRLWVCPPGPVTYTSFWRTWSNRTASTSFCSPSARLIGPPHGVPCLSST